MNYYPAFLNIKGQKCLVVGGGAVGARKAAMLEKCGAKVVVVSLKFCDAFDALKSRGMIFKTRPYTEKDLCGMSLVFAATGDKNVNARILDDAREKKMLCNVADDPDHSGFILPAVISRGDLILAVSTCGASPAMAREIRQQLEEQFGEEYARLLELMRAVRKKMLSIDDDSQMHRQCFHSLIENGILKAVEACDKDEINRILRRTLGEGYTYEKLLGP